VDTELVQESRKEYGMHTNESFSAVTLDHENCAPDKWKVLDEDVFLSQLYKRASILNSDFHKTVLDIVCANMVATNSNVALNQSETIETFFRDSDLYDTECILAEIKDFPENKDSAGSVVKPQGVRVNPETQACYFRDESNFQQSMSVGVDADSGLFSTAQLKNDKSDKFDTKQPCSEANALYSSNNIAVNSSFPKASFGFFSRTKSADNSRYDIAVNSSTPKTSFGFISRTKSADTVLPAASFEVVSSLDQKDASQIPESYPHAESVKQSSTSAIMKVSVKDFIKRFTPGFRSSDRQEAVNLSRNEIIEAHSTDTRRVTLCQFEEGPGLVAVHQAPVKAIARMREKILEYSQKGNVWSGWPLTANILDPIRTSVVCNGPSQILQVVIDALAFLWQLIRFVLSFFRSFLGLRTMRPILGHVAYHYVESRTNLDWNVLRSLVGTEI
jgi:hypothetical protein